MDKDPGAVGLGRKRAENLRKKLGSAEALKRGREAREVVLH
jgi:hypothetical protein